NALPGIRGGRGVVVGTGNPGQEDQHRRLILRVMVVHEAVPHTGIGLNVMLNTQGGKNSFESFTGAGAHRAAVLPAVTADDGTRPAQTGLGVLRAAPVVGTHR